MSLADVVIDVRTRMQVAAERSNRDPDSIRLVAVTKTFDVDQVRAAIEAGIHDIGENRVQEAQSKKAEIDATHVAWHLIGPLQSNKVRKAAHLFDAVHSIEDEATARGLAQERSLEQDPMALLIQVDFTDAPTRHGVKPTAVLELARAVVGLPAVHLSGLMTVAPNGSAEDARPVFAQLRQLRDQVEGETGWVLHELSMGMSGDFEVAIEEGATMVRIGRAIFGERPTP